MFMQMPKCLPSLRGASRMLSGIALLAMLPAARAAEPPPPGFKVAFFGDQGLGPGPAAVLGLVRSEGADLLVQLGDFDYTDNPAAWERQTDSVLGAGFPRIAVAGNHDLAAWKGPDGYGERIRSRLARLGAEVKGEAGVQCSFRYRGLFFVLTAPGLMRTDHGAFIRSELAEDHSIWKISAWHMNQAAMQAGGKPNETGWDVYEESRLGGAIVATAHEHSYSRTHLLSRMNVPEIASRDSVLEVRKGRTFAFVSGLGGEEVRPQLRGGEWWASIYTSTQKAAPGALFAVFHVDGDPRKASFYFKSVDGTVIDRFTVRSEADGPFRPGFHLPPNRPRSLELDPAALGLPSGSRMRVDDINGRAAANVDANQGPVSLDLDRSGLLFLRTVGDRSVVLRTFVLLP
jgi:hypothetical protein